MNPEHHGASPNVTSSGQPDQSNPRPGRSSHGLDIASVIMLTLVAGLIVFHYIPVVRYSLLVAVGRSPVCSYEQALEAYAAALAFTERAAQIEKASRVVEEDPEGFWLWDTPEGRFWAPARHEHGLYHVLAERHSGIYGDEEAGIRPGDIVLDCGAHVGIFTRQALRAGAGLVVAIEPSPDTVEALKRNFAGPIGAGRVIVYEKGVFDKETELLFLIGDDHAKDRLGDDLVEADNVIRVPVTTIDQIVAELNLPRVDFIKMDIEGSEQNALRGAVKTLRTHKPRLAIAAYHRPEDQVEIPKLVVAARPDYEIACGLCGERELRIDVLSYLAF